MSERERRGERTRREAEERERLGPDIDADGRRMDEPRANDGPRRVGAERKSREEGVRHETHRRGDDDRGADNDRGTSWLSVIFGWLAALGASLILSGREIVDSKGEIY
ncbi:MAG: hypothetical protein LC781_09090, partial [Actinobacteria bacterium]|nr:hypothetical protein [Actinomycetota bacterium]